jgi:cytochrome c oxidase cbb3-type subunit 4
MDINDLRTIVTVIAFVTFLGIVFWAYSGRRQAAFDRAARSVLEENDDEYSRQTGRRGEGQ